MALIFFVYAAPAGPRRLNLLPGSCGDYMRRPRLAGRLITSTRQDFFTLKRERDPTALFCDLYC